MNDEEFSNVLQSLIKKRYFSEQEGTHISQIYTKMGTDTKELMKFTYSNAGKMSYWSNMEVYWTKINRLLFKLKLNNAVREEDDV